VHYAAKKGNNSMELLLRVNADKETEGMHSKTALRCAAK
jgi:hypothetical protein